jgi:hypothetical protein
MHIWGRYHGVKWGRVEGGWGSEYLNCIFVYFLSLHSIHTHTETWSGDWTAANDHRGVHRREKRRGDHAPLQSCPNQILTQESSSLKGRSKRMMKTREGVRVCVWGTKRRHTSTHHTKGVQN